MTKTCTLLFLRRNDEILLARKKRGFGTGYFNGAGGKVEPGETIEQAMLRETLEEIAVTPLQYRKVAVHDFVMNDGGTAPWHMHVHAYICSKWRGEPAESDEMAPQWFSLDGIPYHQMWQDDSVWLPLVLHDRLVRGIFHFDRNNDMVRGQFEIVDEL